MFQTKVVEKLKARILSAVPFSENLAVYEIMWNMVEPDGPQVTYSAAQKICQLHNI
jgi:hypothetical protein